MNSNHKNIAKQIPKMYFIYIIKLDENNDNLI